MVKVEHRINSEIPSPGLFYFIVETNRVNLTDRISCADQSQLSIRSISLLIPLLYPNQLPSHTPFQSRFTFSCQIYAISPGLLLIHYSDQFRSIADLSIRRLKQGISVEVCWIHFKVIQAYQIGYLFVNKRVWNSIFWHIVLSNFQIILLRRVQESCLQSPVSFTRFSTNCFDSWRTHNFMSQTMAPNTSKSKLTKTRWTKLESYNISWILFESA